MKPLLFLLTALTVTLATSATAARLDLTIDPATGEPGKFAAEEIRREAKAKGVALGDEAKATRISITIKKDTKAAAQSYRVKRDGEKLTVIGADPVGAMYGGLDVAEAIRKFTLWGSLMAGGAGEEYYFGYQLPENDLICEDFRSRDKSWDYCRIALEFFRDETIPFVEMQNADALIGNTKDDNSKFCFAKAGELYLVYLPNGGTTDLDLSASKGTFTVKWFNPRTGGELVGGSVKTVEGGGMVALGNPPADAAEDWLIVVRR